MRHARTLPLAAALLGLAAVCAAPVARADNVYWSIGITSGMPVRPAPVYVQPAPVYVQPAPVYAPPPMYVYPQPVYTPPRVVYTPAQVVYTAPGYVQPSGAWPATYGWRPPGHGHGHGWGHRHDR